MDSRPVSIVPPGDIFSQNRNLTNTDLENLVDLLREITSLSARYKELAAKGSIGIHRQEAIIVMQQMFTARQKLQWMEKIVDKMYRVASIQGW